MSSIRFDATPVTSYEEMPDGRLRVRASFSRVGPLVYLNKDGTRRVENVPPETLFDAASLDTAGLAAVTLEHPPEFVTPDNWRKYSVGTSGNRVEARVDDGLVDVVFVVGDRTAIDAVKKGSHRQVSAGYTAVTEQRGDGLYQTNRVYNHFALVPAGRAGPEVALHFDADFAVQVDEPPTGDTPVKRWKGFEVEEALYDAIAEATKSAKTDAAASEALQAKCDTLEARIKQLETDLESRMDAAQVEEQVKLRLDCWEQVKPFLPDTAKFDAADTPLTMKMKAIAASNPELDLTNKSEAYVDAAFDVLLSIGPRKSREAKKGQGYADSLKKAAATGEGDRQGSSAQAHTDEEDEELQKRLDAADDAYLKSLQNPAIPGLKQ